MPLNPEFTAPCTLDYLRIRCEECGTCWQWKGAVTNGRFPKLNVKGKQYYARRLAWMIRHGQAVPAGLNITDTCGNHQCVNPRHLKAVTRPELLAAVVQRGDFNTLAFRAAVSLGKRATNRVPDDAVLEIRASTEPARVLAQRHGISTTYAHMIRRGRSRRDWTNPFARLLP